MAVLKASKFSFTSLAIAGVPSWKLLGTVVTAIAIGTDLQSNGKLVLDKKARETHVHVIGASGTGKSYFLEQMIRRDISRGSGVCFIDPHGETYNNLVAWLATSGISARSVHQPPPPSPE